MLKGIVKVGAAVLVIGGLGMLVLGKASNSYVRTAVSRVQTAVDENVPLDFEIDRAKTMLTQLDPDIRRSMTAIAEGEASVARLQRQVAELEQQQETTKTGMLRLKTDLESNQASYKYGGKIYAAADVKIDLKRRLDRYQVQQDTLSKMKEILAARQAALDAAEQKLRNMQAAKRQLEVDIANLEAQHKLIEATQAAGNYNLDDSRLSQTKELVGKLQARLDVTSRLMAVDRSGGEIVLDEPAEDVLEQVTKVLGHDDSGIALEPGKAVAKPVSERK